jgi:hypothetical protein
MSFQSGDQVVVTDDVNTRYGPSFIGCYGKVALSGPGKVVFVKLSGRIDGEPINPQIPCAYWPFEHNEIEHAD